MKRISIFLLVLILILSSCKEDSTNPTECILAGLNGHPHPDTLVLKSVNLVTIPKCIGEMTNLKVVALGFNNITEIPVEFFNLKDLFYFISVDNKLDVLPDEFDKLQSLKYFILENTNLTEIPKSIFSITNLVHLHFTDSPISNIPNEIGNMKNLYWLSLNGTNITHLPESIKNLKDCLNHLELIDTKVPQSHIDSLRLWLPNTDLFHN